MYERRTRAHLLPSPDNPLGERDFEVAMAGMSLELRPVIEERGRAHELRLVRFPRLREPAVYAYDHECRPSDLPGLTVFARP